MYLGQDHKATTGTQRSKKCGRASVWGPETSGLYRRVLILALYYIYSIDWSKNVLAFNKWECLSWHFAVNALSQEEDLQEIIAKTSSKCLEYDEARAQMADLKSAYEKAEQEYNQHKQLINAAAEEADVKKV